MAISRFKESTVVNGLKKSQCLNPQSINAIFTIKGAGGGGGNYQDDGVGGNGGLVVGAYTLKPYVNHYLVVGGKGLSMPPSTNSGPRPVGGGGLAGSLGYGGQGGGYSGIFTGTSAVHASAVAIAAGGGGGGSGSTALIGGHGGGLVGNNGGSNPAGYGYGGTQTAGGAGHAAGSALLGGDANEVDGGGGGGGGGGYYGGGAGANGASPDSGGGGGSSYAASSFARFVTTTGGGASGGAQDLPGTDGSIVISYLDSYPDLVVASGLTFTRAVAGGMKTYTFTAGVGTIYARENSLSGPMSDPNAQYLKLALPLGGTSGTNDITAAIKGSGTNRTMTAVNSPSLSTSVQKFYASSLDLRNYNNNRYLSTPRTADLQIGTSDFTIEMWVYLTDTSMGYQGYASHAGDTTDQQPGWILVNEANGTLTFYSSNNGGWTHNVGSSVVPTTNTWHHIAVSRKSGVTRLFLNGSVIGTNATTGANIGIPGSRELRVGSYTYFPGGERGLSGYMQDFRFYIGVGKYDTTFTPPTYMFQE